MKIRRRPESAQAGARPMPSESLPLTVLQEIYRVCQSFESAWRAGQQPRLEDFLDATTILERTELFRELRSAGCRAGYDSVRRYVSRRLGSTGRPGPRTGDIKPAAPPPPSERKLSFEFIRRAEDREASEQARLDKLREADGGLREALDLAAEFAGMVRKQVAVPLAEWLAKAEGSGCAELRGFAAGLRLDEAAVTAALIESWSNGPVEGQVNRLKFIKRSMFGRAGWRLLRARVKRKA